MLVSLAGLLTSPKGSKILRGGNNFGSTLANFCYLSFSPSPFFDSTVIDWRDNYIIVSVFSPWLLRLLIAQLYLNCATNYLYLPSSFLS